MNNIRFIKLELVIGKPDDDIVISKTCLTNYNDKQFGKRIFNDIVNSMNLDNINLIAIGKFEEYLPQDIFSKVILKKENIFSFIGDLNKSYYAKPCSIVDIVMIQNSIDFKDEIPIILSKTININNYTNIMKGSIIKINNILNFKLK